MLHMCNPASVLTFSKRYSVFVWTGKNDSKTLRVDAIFFENEKKVTKTHTTFNSRIFYLLSQVKLTLRAEISGYRHGKCLVLCGDMIVHGDTRYKEEKRK